MTNLVQFEMPSRFVLERCIPTAAQIAYGFSDGWLSPEGVVQIAAAKVTRCPCASPAERQMAGMDPEDRERIRSLVAQLAVSSEPSESRARLWLFLALEWLYHNRDEFDDPWEVIEMIYADFDYPSEIARLVRWMPHVGPEPPGMATMERRWQEYLRTRREWFANHDPCTASSEDAPSP